MRLHTSHRSRVALSIRRVRAHLKLPVLVLALLSAGLWAQQTGNPDDTEKRRQFLRAREEMRTIPPSPPPEASPKPRPKPRPAATPAPEPEPPPKPRPKPEPEATPRPKPESTPAPVTPRPASPVPAAVTIEKRDIQGIQPAPPAGWWERWKFLSRPIRAEIDRASVRKGRWRYIVVHNSGTRQGNARAFEYYHRNVRHMQNGLAYHFVIGNGTSSGDGEIEIGNRWRQQLQGGHVHSDYLNSISLGICLVGDFNRDVPTTRQLAALEELIRFLRARVGRIDRKWSIVKAHREINPPRWPTDCPGDRFPYRWLHGKFDQ